MSVVAVIQARMGSTRLPGKVLAEVCGKPLLLWQIERLRRAHLVDEVMVATTDDERDDILERFCRAHGVLCYRGSENDVLQRVVNALSISGAELHVECFGDSPLIDPQIVDEFVGYFLRNCGSGDMLTNSVITTYPPGMEVSVYCPESLRIINDKVGPSDPLREHVGLNLTRFPKDVNVISRVAPPWLHAPDFYLEVDEKADLEVIEGLISTFVNSGKCNFGLVDIISACRSNLMLMQRNSRIRRRWRQFRRTN